MENNRINRVLVGRKFDELVVKYFDKYSTEEEIEALADRIAHFTGIHVGYFSTSLAHSNLCYPDYIDETF